MNPANDNRQESSNAPCGACGLIQVFAYDHISKIERPIMKMKTTTIGRIAGFAIAVILFAGATVAVNAQEKGSAKGGATRLMQLSTVKATTPITTLDYKPMSCAHCKDGVITVRTKKRPAKAKGCLAVYSPTRDDVPCETKNSAN